METFSALLAICAGNSQVTAEFPAERPVTRSFMFSLICAWINAWLNNREAGDFRHHRAYYDVTAMLMNIWRVKRIWVTEHNNGDKRIVYHANHKKMYDNENVNASCIMSSKAPR